MLEMRPSASETIPPEIQSAEIGVADATRSIADLVRNALAMWNIRNVRTYAGGSELATIARIAVSRPDILVINSVGRLPSALTIARAIRDRRAFPDPFMAIIMVMANVTRERVLLARDAGVDEFLAFPFSPKALYQRIASIVLDRRGFVATPTYFGPDRRRGAMAQYLGANRRSTSSILINPRTRQTYIEID